MNASTETLALETQAAEIATRLENLAHLNLEEKITLKHLGEKINELIVFANAINDRTQAFQSAPRAPVSRNRGPASEKVMTEEDAVRVMLDDLKDLSHKEAAERLGLSYGQIYSARKGFTFKPIYKRMIDSIKATQAAL